MCISNTIPLSSTWGAEKIVFSFLLFVKKDFVGHMQSAWFRGKVSAKKRSIMKHKRQTLAWNNARNTLEDEFSLVWLVGWIGGGGGMPKDTWHTQIVTKFFRFQWMPSDVEACLFSLLSGSHLVRAGFGTCVGINPIKPHKFGWIVVKFYNWLMVRRHAFYTFLWYY